MTKIKAIVFNGPPRSGKDTAVNWLYECLSYRLREIGYMPFKAKLAESLKIATHALYGEEQLHPEAFEDCKDEPSPIFFGRTPRQAYIDLSENLVKPRHGQDFFAKIFMKRILRTIKQETEKNGHHAIILCSDVGFIDELKILSDAIGAQNVLLVHIHRSGFDFEHDSRAYVKHDGIAMFSITNYDVESFKHELFGKIRGWMDNGFLYRITA